ncbi:TPA: permease [Clostridioides difficile]|uniref:permease n=1 Tax=Clostridioides difficile TaxID=1496 RepID=UPI0009397C90|nr:permease [Clostridioides difficile]EGT5082039.1 permease [Clostridioides difficile]EGT5136213.1 permease [Clostridioides difficile]EGT5283652.1 permease [Clostridioides difficile]MBG0212989.1 permease [Clostridioides difficile]MBJ9783756.1 permease [Clostridioides difficile]
MSDMLLWFSVVLVLFAIGDLIASKTKAKVSAVFVTLLLFLILFVTKAIPADIIEKAGMTAAASWSVPMIMFSMGTMLNVKQFIDEWRTVLTAWLGIVAVIVCVSLCIPLFGKSTVLTSIPVINGALPATTIMTQAALEKGLTLAAATATVVFAIQKFIGTPIASRAALQEANRLLVEYHEAKSKGIDLANVDTDKKEAENTGTKVKQAFCEKYDKYYSTNVCIFFIALFSYLGYELSEIIHVNYSIVCLVVGVIVTRIGIVAKDILEKGKIKGFINMVVFAAVIPSLAKVSLTDLISLFVPIVGMFAASIIGIFLMMKVLPGWKIIGSKPLAFGVGFCQMLGFPTTYLISNEVCNAVGETEEERAYLMSKIMPKLVVGGMACMISIVVAGLMVPML